MNRSFHVSKLLVPYDYSESAALGLEHAVIFAKSFAEIIVIAFRPSWPLTRRMNES